MSEALPPALAALVDREQIRDLVLSYSRAMEARDVDAMADLFVPHARFGDHGKGPDACRALMADSLADSIFAVILVANHIVVLDDADHAHGEVWAQCYAQNRGEPFVEQVIRYIDRYERHEGCWRFLHRRHRLWFGMDRDRSPLDQDAAEWPRSQVGVGDVPLADEKFRTWWESRR